MEDHNLYTLFRSRFPDDSDSVFLQDENSILLRYAALDEETGRLAAFFRELGVVRGDRILVQVEKSHDAVLLYLACLRCGVIYIPLNTAYTAAEVRYFLQDSTPRLVVCAPDARQTLEPLAREAGVRHMLTMDANGQGSLKDGSSAHDVCPDVAKVGADDIAAILYTSGTTGRSKGAMLSHGNLAANALGLQQCWDWRPDDVLLHALPIFHVHGLFVALHCALLSGTSMWFLPRFDAGAIIRLLPRSTVMMGVPTFYTRLLNHPAFEKSCCRSIRLFISGSAPLRPDTFNRFERRTGHRILERYGMTEAGMITSNPVRGARTAGTVGFPLPEVSVRIANQKGELVDDGTVGVLELKGPNVFKGYWQMPDATAKVFRDDGYLVSGDLARKDAEGRISIVGRAKDLVISGGYNVYPKEIETAIDTIDGVDESAVIGVVHPDFGEAVVAVVVRSRPTLNEDEILDTLSATLAGFKRPKRVFFVEELPRNAMGKVIKSQLRGQFRNTFSEQDVVSAPVRGR